MSENKESKNGYGVLIGAVSTVIILWSLNWILLLTIPKSDERGQFGDMFGSVNALFSGLAFAFLIYTIWLQREELKLQREELKLQREALQLQAEELKRQADELSKTAELQAKTFELQKLQMELTQKQIEEEKIRIENQDKPVFTVIERLGISFDGRKGVQTHLRLKNVGGDASNVKVAGGVNLNVSKTSHPFVQRNTEIELIWNIEDYHDYPSETEIKLIFYGSLRKEYNQLFKMLKTTNIGHNPPVEFTITE